MSDPDRGYHVLLTREQLYRIKRALNLWTHVHNLQPGARPTLIPKSVRGEAAATLALLYDLDRIEGETDGEGGEKLKAKPG